VRRTRAHRQGRQPSDTAHVRPPCRALDVNLVAIRLLSIWLLAILLQKHGGRTRKRTERGTERGMVE
jgi:hypothetical protein